MCHRSLICPHLLGQGHLPYLGLDGWERHSAGAVSFAGSHRTWRAAVGSGTDADRADQEMAGNEAAWACPAGSLGESPGETSLAVAGYLDIPGYRVDACYAACVVAHAVALEKSSAASVHWHSRRMVAEPSCALPFAVH